MSPRTAPMPWVGPKHVHAGGLIGVGFADASDLLLVVTHAGRGVVDCLTGERVARDFDDRHPLDDWRRVPGIGPLAGLDIVISGPDLGGVLPAQTNDGWRLEGLITNSQQDEFWLLPPSSVAAGPTRFTGFVPEVRLFGFSPTGRSFVIGTGADLTIFSR